MSFCTRLIGRLFLSGPSLHVEYHGTPRYSLWSKVLENSASHIRIKTQWLEAEPSPQACEYLVAIPACGGVNSNGKLATYNPEY